MRTTVATVLRDRDQAAGYVASICFKTGPPRLIGAELEYTVHHTDDPTRPLHLTDLRRALGPHCPRTLWPDSPAEPLPAGGVITVEPGGQVEISTEPQPSLGTLHAAAETDRRYLIEMLRRVGLAPGDAGLDPHRPPRRLIDSPRYAAMERHFDRRGPDGRIMMCGTAGLQVCVDAGDPHRTTARWAALHALGPPLLAAFATADRQAGRRTGWASARMRAWQRIDPRRTAPVSGSDPAAAWARYALAAPLLCLRRGERWDAPPVTFADWVAGALPQPPTTDDLDYHLGTLFPPVRPRGYLEVRYLDAQPGGEWITPVAVLGALLADDAAVDAARDLAAPAAGRWAQAARHGLADRQVAAAARAVLERASQGLDRTGLPASVRDAVAESVHRRLAGHRPVGGGIPTSTPCRATADERRTGWPTCATGSQPN